MSAFQALIVCLSHPDLTPWTMKFRPFRPKKLEISIATLNLVFPKQAIIDTTSQKPNK